MLYVPEHICTSLFMYRLFNVMLIVVLIVNLCFFPVNKIFKDVCDFELIKLK